jgi:hypothetical protein
MATRLTQAQLDAIEAGQPTRQAWDIQTPASSGSGSFTATSIHDDDGGPFLVVDAGKYEVEGWNVSFASPGKMPTGLYRFTVDNGDSKFSPETTGNYWYDTGGTYQAMPIECRTAHSVKIKLLDGTWSEILYYVGEVLDVQYDDVKKTATIEARAMAAGFLEYKFTADDGTEEDTGANEVI